MPTTARTTAPVAHVCDLRTDGAGAVYRTTRASCPACMAELEAEAIAHDRRATFAYPSGASTVEGAYVDQHRPA